MFKFRVFITAFLLLAALFSVQSNAAQTTQNLNPVVSSHILFTDAVDITKTKPVTESAEVPTHKKRIKQIFQLTSHALLPTIHRFFAQCTK